MKRPNIILFNPDQWRGDALGYLGNEAAVTPTLDKLAATDAAAFSSAFCQNPVCTPSRCSFMSGLYPHTLGHRTMHNMMKPFEPVLLRELKENGYFVWWGGKNDLIPANADFSDYCDIKYQSTRTIDPMSNLHQNTKWRGDADGDNYYSFYAGKLPTPTAEQGCNEDTANVLGAIDFIENYHGDKPFCIYLPLTAPHPPYGVEEPFFSLIDKAKLKPRIKAPDFSKKPALLKGIYDGQRLEGWSEEQFTALKQVYYGMCSKIDLLLGKLCDSLMRRAFYDDTAIFFFSDHGDFTGDYGLVEKTQNTFEDCLTNVPLLIKPPKALGCLPGVRTGLCELVDLSATVYELSGIPPTHTIFGKSLVPALCDPDTPLRDAVFCEGGRLSDERHASEVDSLFPVHPEKSLYWPRVRLQVENNVTHGKAIMCRTPQYKYVRRLYETDELYDLEKDPHELHNQIDNESYSAVLFTLKERLLDHYQTTCDIVPFAQDKR